MRNGSIFAEVNMTKQIVEGYLKAELRRHGFQYAVENGYMVLTAGFGSKRWKMVLTCGDGCLSCYAAYPWQVPHERRERLLERLNSLNASARFGSCFLLDSEQGGMIVFRCDVIIADEYSIAECIEKGFKYATIAICARWDRLRSECIYKRG